MKQLLKRSLACLLVLIMVVGMLPAISITADAASYVHNWGTRGETATELSDMAVAWYEKYNTSYDALSAYSGSSSVGSVPSSALYSQLKTLMTNAHSNKTSYDGTKELYQYTDCQNGGGMISAFYTGTSIGPGWGEGGSWNREHVWPNSKGLGGQDENDIIMLRPTTVSENSSRGNEAFGKSGSYYDPNGESNGKYNLHGDVARICLYVYVRWGNTSYMWGTSGVMESKDVLLEWMEEDPVDTWELGRNDAVQSITGTRNVFVDYPELAFDLFNAPVPDGYDSPSGGTPSYTITAQSNNTNYGTVSLSGKTITATPKTGYYVSGYKVTSGTATVTQSGNTFTVVASSDCTIQIQFSPRTQATVTFVDQGKSTAQTVYSGDAITMPAPTEQTPSGFVFRGWVAQTVAESETKPSECYAEGANYTVNGNKTFYALYAKVEEGTGEAGYQLVTDASQLVEGSSVVIAAAGYNVAVGTTQNINNRSQASITKSGNTITLGDGVAEFTLGSGVNSGTYSFYCAANQGYLAAAASGSNNRLYTNNSVDSAASFAITVNNDGSCNVVSQTASDRNTLQYNQGSSLFACYNSGQKAVALYVLGGTGDVYYTTDPVQCDHSNTENVAAVAATCTDAGYTAGVYCHDCDRYISGHEEVAATGHSWDAGKVTTAATCTTAGVKTYTCSACGETKTESISATGHSWDAGKVTTAATCTTAGVKTYTCSACGETKTESISASGHSWDAGKVTTAATCTTAGVKTYTCSACGETKTESISATGHSYANGICSVCGEVKPVAANRFYVAAIRSTGNYFYLTGELTTTSTKRYQAMDSGLTTLPDVIEEPAEGYVFVLEENSDGTYCIYVEGLQGDNYLGHTSGNSGALVAAENAVKATVAQNEDGTWQISYPASDEIRYLALNSSTGNNYFAWYKTGQAQNLSLIPVGAACDHNNVSTETVEADCTTPGSVTVTCDDCGKVISSTVTPASGHDYILSGTTYTCANCGDSYETFFVSFSVPRGVAAVEKMEYAAGGIVLPEAGVPTGEYAYQFVGWTTGTVDDVTEAPVIYKAGSTYETTGAVTLYALYSYSVGGSGSTDYVLTDIADITETDSVVITMTKGDTVYALSSANGTSSAPGGDTVTVSGDKLTGEPADALKWNVGGSADAYIFYVEGDHAKWLYCTSTNNGVRVGTNTANTFKIDGSTGYLKHNGTNRYVGVYTGNPDWRCYTSTSTNIGGQTLGFYVKGSGGTVYYTTGESCAHTNTTTTTVESTCTVAGSVTVTCDDCGEVISTEELPLADHSYESVVTPPAVGAQGYTTHTCTVCGDSYVDSYVDALPEPATPTNKLRITGVNLALMSDLKINFFVPTAVMEEYENVHFVFTIADREVTVSEGVNTGSRYQFALAGIAPRMMNDTINIKLYGTFDGVVYEYTNTYKIADYCYNQIRNASNTATFKTLLVDLLNFGAAHQVYGTHNLENMVNAGLTDEEKALGSSYEQSFTSVFGQTGTANGASFRGASLVLSDAIVIRYTVQCDDLTDVTFRVSFADSEYVFDASEFVPVAGYTNRYTIDLNKLTARQMSEVVSATVYRGEEAISKTATYSVESYAAGVNVNDGSVLGNLVKYMMYYGYACVANQAG